MNYDYENFDKEHLFPTVLLFKTFSNPVYHISQFLESIA